MTQLSGFIPSTRAPLAMDLVVVAMAVVLPLLAYSIAKVKRDRDYAAHKRLQLGIGAALLVAVTLFEVDVRVFGWRPRAEASPYYETWLFPFLYVHLCVAVATTFGWIVTVAHALRQFERPPRPGAASRWHRRLGKLTAVGTFLTAITGWTFYWAAFIAT